MPRRYEMKRRAEQVERTRLRITEAAVELHGTIGPARTTITAIAERAGVDRLTVYRHFPTEDALFAACSAHWLGAHPYPDPAPWAAIADPRARLAGALGDLYAWYRENHTMMERVLGDAADGPVPHGSTGPLGCLQRGGRRSLGTRLGRARTPASAPRGCDCARGRHVDLALAHAPRPRRQ